MDETLNGFTGFAQKDKHAQRYAKASNYPAPSGPRKILEFDDDKLAHIEDTDRRWAWAEIDLNAIRHNVVEAKNRIGKSCRLLAVVKADAYGHGAIRVAKTALNSGAEQLGVATVPEAIELREAGIVVPILILAEPPISSIPLLLKHRITPAVYSPDFAIQYAEIADAYDVKAPFHLAVNTGMNRIGVPFNQVVDFMRKVSFHRALQITGIFTHFATADCPETFDFQRQYARFVEAVNALRAAGIDPGIVHCANSAAIFRYPETHFDMARLGISLYGFHPCPETYGICDLHPAMSIHARITDMRSLPINEGVSYGLHYRSNGSVITCTVPIGYADGLRRALSGNWTFLCNGEPYRQVGNICMDQCMFEVDMRNVAQKRYAIPQIGDEVIIAGVQGQHYVSIDEMAKRVGTIQHEITCGFGIRLDRVYV